MAELEFAAANPASLSLLILGQESQLSQSHEIIWFLAAADGYSEICEMMILVDGFDVDAQDENGLFALDYAVENGHIETVRVLCNYEATVDFEFFLRSFKKLKCQEMTRLLLENSINPNAFISTAAEKGHLDFVEWCCESSEEYLRYSGYKTAAFVKASMNNHKEIVAYLLPKVDSSSYTEGLSMSVFYGYEEIVMMTLDHWLVSDYRQDFEHNLWFPNRTILHEAAEEGHVNLVRLFIQKYNADVNFKCDNGQTPLHSAAINGNCEIIKLILNAGANVNDVDNENLSALHFGTLEGHVEAVETLLKFGGDINQENKNGETALIIAVSKSLDQVAKVLIKHFVKIKLCGEFVNERNLSALNVNQELHKYYAECEQELKSLMEKKFVDSSLSYYSVCEIKDVNKLGAMANNENIVKVLKSVEFVHEFPIYGSIIVEHFESGILRKKYFERVVQLFKHVACRTSNRLPMLQYTCIYQIFAYLTEQDCENLLHL